MANIIPTITIKTVYAVYLGESSEAWHGLDPAEVSARAEREVRLASGATATDALSAPEPSGYLLRRGDQWAFAYGIHADNNGRRYAGIKPTLDLTHDELDSVIDDAEWQSGPCNLFD